MIEILAALLDAVVKAIPGVKDHRARQKHAEIGAALLRFYNEANTMLLSADVLIRILHSYEGAGLSERERYDLVYFRKEILRAIRQQSQNLQQVERSYQQLSAYLGAVIDNDSFRRLARLFSAKVSALDVLAWLMDDHQVPLDVEFALEQLIGRRGPGSDHAVFEYRDSLQTLPLGDDFSAEHLPLVQAYFRLRNPEAELDQISISLEKIRKAILENFKLEDVLMKVRDERLRS